MKNRRNFLRSLSGAAGLLAASAASAGMPRNLGSDRPHNLKTGQGQFDRNVLVGKSQMPAITVETSEGTIVQLYDDLIKDKVVTINFMSIENEAAFPITELLAKVARLLGPRLGDEVNMISITNDPAHDTPERLREFAKRLGAPAGWYFVRASDEGHAMMSARLYHHGRRHHAKAKIDMVHYGNDLVGLWSSFPATIHPEDAVMRLASVANGVHKVGPLRQAGPRRLGEAGPSFNNRIA